jgi:acyl-CoA synthetase (NDP forming)
MPVSLADALFRPRGIAVLGASNDPAKLSGRPLDYLLRLGYPSGIYPINPTRPTVQGQRAYADIADAAGPIDLAIIVVPSIGVPQALRDCAAAGVAVAIVFASGFGEMGGEGDRLAAEVAAIVRDTTLRVLGPNCLGAIGLPGRSFATFATAFDEQGSFADDPVAVVSQSGAVASYSFTMLANLGVGVRYFANTGNEADIGVGELLHVLAEADDVSILLGYLESSARLDAVAAAAASAQARGKPLILLKAGATPEGARAVGAHTASVAGDDAAFDAMVARHGAIRTHSIEEATDAVLAFRPGRWAMSNRLAILSVSGGAGALATDAAVRAGLAMDILPDAVRARIAPMLPPFGSTANPVDMTGSLITDPAMLARVIAEIVPCNVIDMLLVVLGNADRGSEALVDGLAAGFASTAKPFAVSWSGGSGRPARALVERGIPTYPDPSRAVRSLSHLVRAR